MYKTKTSGFTLLELLVTIAIIAIIAAIAIPTYQSYARKAAFSELVRATAPFKLGVAECFQTTGSLTGCTAGSNGVPADSGAVSGTAIASIATAANGVITATPADGYKGLASGDTYVLTPTASGDVLNWTASGAGASKYASG